MLTQKRDARTRGLVATGRINADGSLTRYARDCGKTTASDVPEAGAPKGMGGTAGSIAIAATSVDLWGDWRMLASTLLL